MLPGGLGPAGFPAGPEDHGQVESDREFLPRPITMEEAVGRQLDRIAFLRSVGHPWDEAVMVLRDMVVGLEDKEFWDGIPDRVRDKMQSLPVDERKKVKEQYASEGWKTMPVAAFKTSSGRTVYRPTPEQLSMMLRCVMGLLQRRGITWRHKNVSRLGDA